MLILGIILAVQGVASLCLRNTAFQDEALYLVAGRQLFHHLIGGPAVTEPYAEYFSGLPFLYPVLAGALDVCGGLETARFFSLMCMLTVTAGVYLLTRHWFSRESGLAAAALFAVQGSVLFLGRLATYDALCLTLLAGAALLALRAGTAPRPAPVLLLGAVLLLASAIKYAGLLFVPVVLALLAWQTGQTYGWRQAWLRTAMAVGVMACLIILCLVLLDRSVVIGITTTTTNRTVLAPVPRPVLAERAVALGGIMFGLAVAGCLAPRRHSVPALVMLVAALLAPAYHLYKGEGASLEKHVAYGLFFAAPLAGYAFAGWTWPVLPRRSALLIIWGILGGAGWLQAHRAFTQWPNSTSLIHELRAHLRPGDRILAEEMHVPQYYLQAVTAPEQWHDLYGIDYDAHAEAGSGASSVEAVYRSALAQGHYDLILLQYGPMPDAARQVVAAISESGRYDLVLQQPFDGSSGVNSYWLWRLHTDNAANLSNVPDKEELKQPTSLPGNWRLELHAPAAATLGTQGAALKVDVAAVDGTDWHIQLYQDGLALREGAAYELQFRAKASAPRPVDVYAGVDRGDYHKVGLEKGVPLTAKWQRFRLTFNATSTVLGEVRAPVFCLGGAVGSIWLSDVSLKQRR
jgi:hypothetical protein